MSPGKDCSGSKVMISGRADILTGTVPGATTLAVESRYTPWSTFEAGYPNEC